MSIESGRLTSNTGSSVLRLRVVAAPLARSAGWKETVSLVLTGRLVADTGVDVQMAARRSSRSFQPDGAQMEAGGIAPSRKLLS